MGTGWRRAFCTSIPRDREDGGEKKHQNQEQQEVMAVENPSSSPSPRSCAKLGFFSNPSTPRLRCRTTVTAPAAATAVEDKDKDKDAPSLQCKTTTTTPTAAAVTTKSPRIGFFSNPSSPRSPSRFALLRSLRLSRSGCGICMAGVKTGQGTAIFTAECGHAFHFPCIAAHVRKQGCLSCPVCSVVWRHAPLLALHHKPADEAAKEEDDEARTEPDKKKATTPTQTPKASSKLGPDSRAYDDDEPLLSPRFNPIPEADEDDDEEGRDDVGEFQGFFANPAPTPHTAASARIVEAQMLRDAAVVFVSRTHESYAVALRIKAPPAPPPERGGGRAPVDLVAALDVGGAMTDEKMDMLKRAVRLVIASLGPADRLSFVVAFPGNTRRMLPLRRMTQQGQRAARRLVDSLVSSPGTASVSDALRKAAKVLEDRRERNPVATIMLLSDGQDDRVLSTNHRCRHQVPAPSAATRFAHVEIPVHSIGFGSVSGLEGSGSGHDAFAKCVGGMLSVVVQELRVHLSFPSGDIAAVYSLTGRPALLGGSGSGSGWVRLGDLYAEEERELLLELRVPVSAAASHHAMSVKFAYRDPASQELVQSKEQALLVPRPHAVRSSDPKIERMRGAFVATRAVAEARRLAERDDLGGAHHMLSSARALLQSGSAPGAENLRVLEAELAELQSRRHFVHHQHTPRRRGEHGNFHHHAAAALVDEHGEPLTPTSASAWRAAEQLAKVAIMRKSMNRVSDLHGFENARF